MKFLSPKCAGSFGLAKRGRYLRLAVLLTAFLTAATVYSAAQAADGTILGTVTDASGAVVPAAVVIITNIDTGTARTLTTNSDGQYVAPGLNIGRYKVRAEAKGFK